MLDYWVDLMDFEADEAFPEDVILSELDGASFIIPSESVTLHSTGIDASYPNFGFTFHRAKFDDWLRDRAEDAGAEYRVGVSVTGVETDQSNEYSHRVSLASGGDLEADFLILADGPQRTITVGAVGQFLPGEETLSDRLPSTEANHIAYQEHRRMPEEIVPRGHHRLLVGRDAGPHRLPVDLPERR